MANAERVALLVADLRGDEFRIGKNMLRTPAGEYCCLGVACERYHRETSRGRWVLRPLETDGGPSEEWFFEDGEGDFSSTVLPNGVAQWFGFRGQGLNSEADPYLYLGDGTRRAASYVNDKLHKTFPEIGDAFERTYVTPQDSSS